MPSLTCLPRLCPDGHEERGCEVMCVNVLLTGPPRCGKTTLVERVVASLEGRVRLSGFLTREVRAGGVRVGFDIITMDGTTAPLARKGRRDGPRVGSYRVDVPSLEDVAVPALEDPGAQVFVVDEIGLMELVSPAFRDAVSRLLDDPRPMLATIRYRPQPFCDRIKARWDVGLVVVTPGNREGLVGTLSEGILAKTI